MISKNGKETIQFAQELAKKVQNGGLICLYGDLGSGKTTFTKGIANFFDLPDFSIKSPTYTYIREYNAKGKKIFHIDLYRLENLDQLLWQEISELLEDEKNIIIIEWADKMEEYLPANRLEVHFKYLDENSREIITK